MPRASQRVKETMEQQIANGVRQEYETVLTESSSIQCHGGRVRYALYPIWVLHTSWQDRNYLFAMNGQTGKFVGNLPMDKKAWFRWWCLYGAIASAAVYALAWLFMGM